jgi:hypothetical protein
MNARLYYSYTNFDTDSKSRGDYEENEAGITMTLSPSIPSKIVSK